MKMTTAGLALILLSMTAMTALRAEETRESAAAHMRKVDPKEMDPASKGVPSALGQKLVDEALAKHPEVILLALHAGAPKFDIIASNFGRIGKLADEDDMRVIEKGTKNLELNKDGTHFEDELPLKTKDGRVIGAIGVVFRYKNRDDKTKLDAIAVAIQQEMQSQIASEADLLH